MTTDEGSDEGDVNAQPAPAADTPTADVDGAALTVNTPELPAAFPKKRRGRPPGRPNMTVREEDYKDNALVQTWNAAKWGRPASAVAINIREALTDAALVHDTQRHIYRIPSREVIYFVQGWITARHIASQRPSYINGLLIHSRGQDAPVSCAQCVERRTKNALGPFLTCRVLPGMYNNSCSNCKWFDGTSSCSLYTGPKPNRKRKAKEAIAQEPQSNAPANTDGENYVHMEERVQSVTEQETPENDSIDPALQVQEDDAVDMQLRMHFEDLQGEYDA